MPHRRAIRILWPLVILVLALSRAAVAQELAVSHGTFFIFGLSTDYAVVAIDSRGTITTTNRKNRVNDRFCKVRPLSPTAFFFSTGLDTAFYVATGREIFDTRDIANDVYANAGRSSNFETMADKWATWSEAAYRHATLMSAALKDPMAKGYFVGTKDDGEIGAGAATIGYHRDTAQHFSHTSEGFTPTAKPRVEQPNGQPVRDIEHEFTAGGLTDRAKKIMQDVGWATARSGPDTAALHLSTLVAAVRDWSGNDTIGGDIATIVLERGQPWRWFHRPDFCPEQKAVASTAAKPPATPAAHPGGTSVGNSGK